MDLIETLRTTGAVREFRPQPVADDVVARILETARFAPSGGNRQAWHVVVVKDPRVRRGLRDLYLPGWYEYLAMRSHGLVPWAPVTDADAEARARDDVAAIASDAAKGSGGFAEHLDAVPVLLDALPSMGRQQRCLVARNLLSRWSPEPAPDWRTWNRSRAHARQLVQDHDESLKKIYVMVQYRPCPYARAIRALPLGNRRVRRRRRA